jgi:hypothetical protein
MTVDQSDSLKTLATKCENVLQLGGIRTGSFDYPNPNGGQSCRVAQINTGSGLRFVVALDRGGDLGEASFNGTNLAFLTPNDYKPPSHAYHRGDEWLKSWPGGLLTTCGPGLMGEPRNEAGRDIPLHGHFSNTPAAVVEVANPDLATGNAEMRLRLRIHDSRMFGPNIEVQRTIRCWLGQPVISLADEVVNRGDERCPHGMLYHMNLGYPLLDDGARLVFVGKSVGYCMFADYRAAQLEALKDIPPPSERFSGMNEGVIVIEEPSSVDGWTHCGLINQHRQLAVHVSFPSSAMPRLANWQHFGPRGSYVTALEPFSGSLFGLKSDSHPNADLWIESGMSRKYSVRIRVCSTAAELADLVKHDAPLTD